MHEIDQMDMLGFLALRAWDAGQEAQTVESKSSYIDEVWQYIPNMV